MTTASVTSSEEQPTVFKFLPFLPQKQYNSNSINSTIDDSQENSDLSHHSYLSIIESDLNTLLCMKFNPFLESMMRDDVQNYLNTFLQYSHRLTDDIQHMPDTQNEGTIIDMYGISDILQSIHKKTFLIIYRLIISYPQNNEFKNENESDINYSDSEYSDLLYNHWLFDIPRIFDFCSIYYFSNPEICSKIIQHLFKIQPKYNTDLSHAIQIVLLYISSLFPHMLHL